MCVCVCACMCGGDRVCLCVRLPLCASATPLQLPLPVCLSCQEARLGPEGRWDELMQQGAERCFVRRDGGALGVWALEHELRPGGSAVRCVPVCVCVCVRERETETERERRADTAANRHVRRLHVGPSDTQPPALCSGAAFSLCARTRKHAHTRTRGSVLLLGKVLGGQGSPCLNPEGHLPCASPCSPSLTTAGPPCSPGCCMPALSNLASSAEMSTSLAPRGPCLLAMWAPGSRQSPCPRSPRALRVPLLLSLNDSVP